MPTKNIIHFAQKNLIFCAALYFPLPITKQKINGAKSVEKKI